ncbi:DUF3846 domain-containing protein [Halobacillus rhizosphaerae]|uniref:DUF3846 domain-containing protein n=1 Tax=Halobacillus rhizosphaerae TaxID=3064889 RepID=UPI00398B4DD8
MKIQIIKIKTGKQSPTIEEIENDLESMQKIVGGYIECVNIPDTQIDLWINEEGKINEMEQNMLLLNNDKPYDIICGDVFFASHDSHGNTTGLNEDHIEKIQQRLRVGLSKETGETILALVMD